MNKIDLPFFLLSPITLKPQQKKGRENFFYIFFSSNVLLSLGKLNNRSIDLKIFRIWNWIFARESEVKVFPLKFRAPQGWIEKGNSIIRHLKLFFCPFVKCKSIFVQLKCEWMKMNKKCKRKNSHLFVLFLEFCGLKVSGMYILTCKEFINEKWTK